MKMLKILLVEDNPGDIKLLEEALKDTRVAVDLQFVKDGAEALAFLKKEGKYSKVWRPDLILLDLNLPKIDGREVLAEVKSDPNLKRIPIVVLTSSRAKEDMLQAYGLLANCYIAKPDNLNEYISVVKTIMNFWSSAEVPSET